MNRLQILKRAFLSVSAGIKNLLPKDYLDTIRVKSATVSVIDNGVTATATAYGYGNSLDCKLLDNPLWGHSYTVKCNIKASLDNMTSSIRAGYYRTDTHAWVNFAGKEIKTHTTGSEYEISFTLPDTQPELFNPNLELGAWKDGCLRLFFNIQINNLGELGSITVTDILVTQND